MSAVANLPGFDASLRLLVECERYSMTDIALMFGVSGERVRQWCEKRGISHPDGRKIGLHCVRVWDDSANRFSPVSRGKLTRLRKVSNGAKRRAAQAMRRAERRTMVVAALVDLRAELGREPSWTELASRLGFTGMPTGSARYVASLWTGGRWTTDFIDDFTRATGYVPRPRGFHGHMRPLHEQRSAS